MSASRIGRLSPSSVAQDWADRVSRSKGSDGQLLFPSEVPDLSLHVQRSVTGLSGHENKQYIQQVSSRDVRNSPVSTATHISQSQQQNDSGKCRQLPCRTFVSTGTCPYSDRCVFLHDPSIVSKPVFMKVKVYLVRRSSTIPICGVYTYLKVISFLTICSARAKKTR